MYCIGLFLYLPMASSNQTEHINDSCHGDLALHDLGTSYRTSRSAAAPRQVCKTTEKVQQIGLAFCFICNKEPMSGNGETYMPADGERGRAGDGVEPNRCSASVQK